VREDMKYEKHPCVQCGRLITAGYCTDKGVMCKRCYDKYIPNNWLDSVIKIDREIKRARIMEEVIGNE